MKERLRIECLRFNKELVMAWHRVSSPLTRPRIFWENLRISAESYTVLKDRRTTQDEWEPLLGRLDDLEREVGRVHAQPSRIDETRIEDRMVALQRRLDEEITAGRLTHVQGRELQVRLDAIRREFLQQIKDRPFTQEERAEISSRLDSLERDINRVW